MTEAMRRVDMTNPNNPKRKLTKSSRVWETSSKKCNREQRKYQKSKLKKMVDGIAIIIKSALIQIINSMGLIISECQITLIWSKVPKLNRDPKAGKGAF